MRELLRLLACRRRYTPPPGRLGGPDGAGGRGARASWRCSSSPPSTACSNPNAVRTGVPLFTHPIFHHQFYLDQLFPWHPQPLDAWWRSPSWRSSSSRASAITWATTWSVTPGFSAVTDLRNGVFDKVLQAGRASSSKRTPPGQLMSSIMNDIDKVQVATSHMLADLLRQSFAPLGADVRGARATTGSWRLVSLTRAAVGDAADARASAGASAAPAARTQDRQARAEPDPAGDPQRPHGGEGFRRRSVRIAAASARPPRQAAQNQRALRAAAGASPRR